MGSIAAPANPCLRISIALRATWERTSSQNGWAKASFGSVNLPLCTQNAAQETSGGPSKYEVGEFEPYRHQRHVVRASHTAGDEMAECERRQHLARGGEVHLRAHQHHGIILAGIVARDVVQARGRYRHRLLAARPRPDGLDDELLCVAQQRRQIIDLFRRVQLDDAVARRVADIHHHPAKALTDGR